MRRHADAPARYLPRNAGPILAARLSGRRPRFGVVASFVGQTKINAPHVYCDSGRLYDWAFMTGLQSYIVTAPGIDCADAISCLYASCDPAQGYPAFIDSVNQRLAYVVGSRPIQLWQVKQDSQAWRELFPWNS